MQQHQRLKTNMSDYNQKQDEYRDIRNSRTTLSGLDSLKADAFNAFKRKLASIAKTIPIKQSRQKALMDEERKAADEEMAKVGAAIDRKVNKPNIKRRTGNQKLHPQT